MKLAGHKATLEFNIQLHNAIIWILERKWWNGETDGTHHLKAVQALKRADTASYMYLSSCYSVQAFTSCSAQHVSHSIIKNAVQALKRADPIASYTYLFSC
jgi:predicted metal-binding protein